jgi:hypothetical protein
MGRAVQDGMARAMEVVVATARFGAGYLQPPPAPPGLPLDTVLVGLGAVVVLVWACSHASSKLLRGSCCPCRFSSYQ